MRSTPDRRKAIFSAAVLPELEAITREIARGRAAGGGRWVAMDGALQMSVDNCELNRKLIHLSTRHNQPREPRSVTRTQTDRQLSGRYGGDRNGEMLNSVLSVHFKGVHS